MSDAYIENLVKAKEKKWLMVLKVLLIIIAINSGILVLAGNYYAAIILIPVLIGIYFATMNQKIEYEYLYMDREISIDKIFNQMKRKKIDNLQVDRIEILAPINSYHLDSFKNKTLKVKNYAAAEETDELKQYVIIYADTERIYISITEKFAKAIKGIAPRKVFME